MDTDVPDGAPKAAHRSCLLVVTTSYPTDAAADGREAAGAFVADFVRTLAETCDVRVVAPGRRAAAGDVARVRTWRFRADRPLSLLSPLRPWHWWPIVRTLAGMRRAVRLATADGRVAHALALWILPSGWAVRSAAPGLPYSVWALGSDIWMLARVPVVRRVLHRVASGAATCHADGYRLCDDARRATGRAFDFLPSARIQPFARQRPIATVGPYRLLFLGRWHPNKGVDLLLHALAMLDDTTWSKIERIDIAGGGPLEAVVHARVAALQARGRPVRGHGFLDPEAAARAMNDADYLVLPSRIESIPVVFSDALHFGLPVVATPVGDLPRLLDDGRAGVLAEAADPEAFARAITEALSTPPIVFAGGISDVKRHFDLQEAVRDLLRRIEVHE